MARELNLPLPSVDDLFSIQAQRDGIQQEQIEHLPADLIDNYPDHPFMVRMDAKMLETIESVGQYGVLTPCIVRPKANGRYEMIAGHRRKRASTENGILTIPCVVRKLTDEEATIIMVDSNLQREVILPSEKAFAYKMKLDAMKRQGQRTDLTSVPVAQKLEGKTSREVVGEQVGESQDQVRRFVRLTQLTPELLTMADNATLAEKDHPQIALRPAVELSYLPAEAQQWVVAAIAMEDATPNHTQTKKMRQFAKDGLLSEGVVLSILQEEKPNQAEKIKIPRAKINPYFPPDTPAEEVMSIIIKALKLYRARERKRKNREREMQAK